LPLQALFPAIPAILFNLLPATMDLKTQAMLRPIKYCPVNHIFVSRIIPESKGPVEQVNGLIRRFIPKKTDITEIPEKTI
jgi:hypothetical protein